MSFILFIAALVVMAAVASVGYMLGFAEGRKSVADDYADELADLILAQVGSNKDETIAQIRDVLGRKRI